MVKDVGFHVHVIGPPPTKSIVRCLTTHQPPKGQLRFGYNYLGHAYATHLGIY